MAEPTRFAGQASSNMDVDDNDIDGEYEVDDVEYEQVAGQHTARGNTTDAEGSDVDAEGEEVDDDDDDGEPVGAVKVAPTADLSSDEEGDDHDVDATGETESDAKTSESEASDASGSDSEGENDWQAESESEDGEEQDAGRADPNLCTFCDQDEDHDPSEVYEEYLSCVECGDNAHRQCARDANTLSSDDDAKQWRCAPCLQNELGEDDGEEVTSASVTRRRLSSVPKLARDLLPSHRGADPGGYSIFNDLILADEPVDGSRSLRKRKASYDAEPHAMRQARKKRRSSGASRSEIEVGGSLAHSSPRASRPSTRNGRASGMDTDGDDAHGSGSEQGSSRLRSARARASRPKRSDKRPLVWIEENTGFAAPSIVVVFHLTNEKVQKIVTSKPKKKPLDPRLEARRERDRERRDRNRKAAQQRAGSPEMSHYPAIQSSYSAPFYGFQDKELDETKNKPYGGILSEADADTTKTYPTPADRKRFEDARLKAEEAWKEKQAAINAAQEPTKPSKQAGPPSKIKCINFGGWEIDTWHAAPYPEEYSKNKVLYICEFCLKYMNSDYVAWRHKLKCPAKHPPGDEIYRDGRHSFFEVDGRKNPVYCQNLCLLAKLFLGSKTLYYDVEPFLFYVMTENDNYGCHFVGYFSKEKRPSSLNNVSCILALPIHMRKGYGQYMIEFSYLLTRVEKKTGSPEKPLSDMGLVTYRRYWRLVLCKELLNQKGPISITAISDKTGMTPDDIVSALEGLRALVRDPVTKNYAFRLDFNYFKQYIAKAEAGNYPKIDPNCLIWTPYVMGRFGQYEDGPALHTVQPREDFEDEGKVAPEEGVQQQEAAKLNGIADNASPVPDDAAAERTTPALPNDDSQNSGSPAPGTPLANGSMVAIAGSQPSATSQTIPPTRYEVFPPIPGMPASKRRPGRPFGSRRRTSTPQRNRHTPLAMTMPNPKLQLSPSSRNGSGKASPSLNGMLRRTRSRLGESVINGIDEDEATEGGPVKAIRNGRRSGTRSATGSPRVGRLLRGKSRVIESDDEEEEEEEDEEDEEEAEAGDEEATNGAVNGDDDADADGEIDVDAEGEEDVDAEGELDIDAEGEDDDELDLVMVGGP